MSCTSTDPKAAVLVGLREHPIQVRNYYNRPQRLRPYFAADPELAGSAGPPVAEDICSQIVVLPVHENPADDHGACLLSAAQEGCSR